MQEDPIAFAAGDENIHRYVGNDPVNAVDPTGLVSQEPPGGPGSPGGEADRHVNQQCESTGASHIAAEQGWLSSLLLPAVSWFGWRRGDATDQVYNFTYGVGDELLLGTPRYFRQSVYGDYDQVDYDGNAYYAGNSS